jgi:dolichyl-phosphate beta-glucosyltransferase
MLRTVIVVPCYNESSRLPFEEFKNYILKNEQHFLFVNDGSTDGTVGVLNKLAKECDGKAEVLDIKINCGKAEAVRVGLKHCVDHDKFDLIGYWDADLSTKLEEIQFFLNLFEVKPLLEVVLGARVKLMGKYIYRKPIRHYFGRAFATVASNILRAQIYDTQCGAKIMKASLIKSNIQEPFISKWIFDVELLARFILVLGYSNLDEKIYEHPLQQWKDVGGSKITLKSLLRLPVELFKIYLYYNKSLSKLMASEKKM